jgi:hypothetical protein
MPKHVLYRWASQQCPTHSRRFCNDPACKTERNHGDYIANRNRTAPEPDPQPEGSDAR